MADTKLPALTAVTTPALDDLLYVVDVHDTTDDPTGSSRKMPLSQLNTLVGSDISITGATTATIGRWHAVSDSGTPANYTLTLPSPAGVAGQRLGVRVEPTTTKLVTIDAGAGVTIDGVSTTLSAAVTSTTATTITVTSATGFPASGTYLILVDSEFMLVTGGQGTTTWTVTRGYAGSTAATHSNGVAVDRRRTRILWAGEYLVLESTGSNWRKAGGRSIPMTFHATRTGGNTSVSTGVWTKIPLDTQDGSFPGPGAMWDSTNGQAIAQRDALWQAEIFLYAAGTASTYVTAGINAVNLPKYQQNANVAGAAAAGEFVGTLKLFPGDTCAPYIFSISAGSTVNGSTAPADMTLTEIPPW